MARFDNLHDWLDWQETLHPDPVDLGLERVGEVAARLGLSHPDATVITVAGTNGKGSSVAMLDSIYRAAGYHTGVYTSPHLLAYNERIRCDGVPADDASLCAAFEKIDQARGDISLTYFEFGTLAALDIFRSKAPDILLLEVGMGGRLDAVNIIDADAALVTSIGIDHSQWLGTDRESIGREKAGIFRQGRPAVCSDPSPPGSLEMTARSSGATWYAPGEQFSCEPAGETWTWVAGDHRLEQLPRPALAGRHQLDNAAGVLMVIDALQARCPVPDQAIASGLRSVALSGRCQVVAGPVQRVLDVAHNQESARQLAGFLQDNPVRGETWLVLGMLGDKDVAAFVAVLVDHIDHWCLASLPGPRGLSSVRLGERTGIAGKTGYFDSVTAAVDFASQHAASDDRIVITGSFLSVAEALSTRV